MSSPKRIFVKGNEAISRGALAAGMKCFFGYPITPQNDIPEFLSSALVEAGGQFVQKMAMLAPNSRLRTGIAANPGAYVFPDSEVAFPYGLKGVDPSSVDLATAFSRNVVLLLGEQDADANQGVLDESAAAMRQGPHRLARGRNFYAAASSVAERRGLPFEWRLQIVPDVGHENQKMAAAAAVLLAEPGEATSASHP